MGNNFCSVAIYLYGESISIEAVSELLGLAATRSRNRGEVRITSSGSKVLQKIGFWEYRVEVDIESVSSAMEGLIDLVKCSGLVGQAGIEKAELDVFVPLDEGNGESGFSFEISSSLVNRLSELKFDVVVTSR